MKLRMTFIILTAFVLVSALQIFAQDAGDSAQSIQNLREQVSKVQDKEAELKVRLDQMNSDLKPENIERYFNAFRSTRPEDLRESRRRQLQTEKDCVVAQLEQLAASRDRLDCAISSAQAKAYPQSAPGAVDPQRDPNPSAQTLTDASSKSERGTTHVSITTTSTQTAKCSRSLSMSLAQRA
jgi:hypothetical protein